MIDTHSHIYEPEFDSDRDEVVARAKDAGVERLLLPAIDAASDAALFDTCRRYGDYVVPMMGLHPTSVNDNPLWREELQRVVRYLDTPPQGVGRFCAIGEIGLDLYWSVEWREEQIEAFQAKYPGRNPRVIVFSGSTNDVVAAYWKEQIRNNTALNDFVATNFVCWSDNSVGTPGIGVRSIDDLVRDIVATGGVLSASQIFEFLRDALVADELPVDASSATLAIAGGTVFAYTGGVHRPDATVKLGSVAIPASCYDLVYSGDGVDAGEYSVHAVFKGAYCGETAAVTYTVAPKAVLPSDISLVPASAVYD